VNVRQVSFRALKTLLQEDSNPTSMDVEEAVKFSLYKMGIPLSMVDDEDLRAIIEEVGRGVQEYRSKQQSEKGRDMKRRSSITRETWYREAEEKTPAAICPTDPAEREDVDQERSHLPGDGRLKPKPFRKYPKKIV